MSRAIRPVEGRWLWCVLCAAGWVSGWIGPVWGADVLQQHPDAIRSAAHTHVADIRQDRRTAFSIMWMYHTLSGPTHLFVAAVFTTLLWACKPTPLKDKLPLVCSTSGISVISRCGGNEELVYTLYSRNNVVDVDVAPQWGVLCLYLFVARSTRLHRQLCPMAS